jgi:hypothetical protein
MGIMGYFLDRAGLDIEYGEVTVIDPGDRLRGRDPITSTQWIPFHAMVSQLADERLDGNVHDQLDGIVIHTSLQISDGTPIRYGGDIYTITTSVRTMAAGAEVYRYTAVARV